MKPFLILALAALAHARPEAPGGYSYNAPSGHSSGLSGGSGFGGGHGGAGHGLGLGHGGSSGHGGSFGSTGLGFSGLSGGFGGGSGSSFGGAQSFSGAGSSGSSFGGSSFGGSSFGGSSFGGGSGSSFSSGSSFGGFQSQAPLISKHVYVHVAPEEPEIVRPARINAATQARKHYKIVFIKAPTAPTPTAAQVQLPQQDEEKTIIYVLSKKQEDQAEINVQAAAPTTPTKPEVYFIKYNTKKEQGGSGLNLSAGAGPSSSYGVPSSHAANAAAPSSNYLSANAAAPSSSYGVPSSHGGPY